ncbi:toll/interleukin-1 receptor domain-containing protein [Acaryochloris marina]|uniref:toll/interleukin-1 receptor domain-containing protein n=1 Tax=Acaryochloris marina TaxID=155978 RepID=UPI001BB070DD|nr:toll/interleukin-1 receptor domain-containing protein [Acaryochloris marina]QUY41584.1 toll/interleukin-1 receptor domain-containing protein [Acaryochloris marina S15]
MKDLADAIESLGHTIWFDQELSGGQVWWDQILLNIRTCDLFVFVLTPESLQSTACLREYDYANQLGKPILPILAADGVSINLLPTTLLQIQAIDYQQKDHNAALALARALANLPDSKPLTNPLPIPPEVPISYIVDLATKIGATILSYDEQKSILVDLKRSLNEPELEKDVHILLEKFRKRIDICAVIAEEIDNIDKKIQPSNDLSNTRKYPPYSNHHLKKITWRTRQDSAIVGSLAGFIYGATVTKYLNIDVIYPLAAGVYIGIVSGAISGVLIGVNRRCFVFLFISIIFWSLFIGVIDNTTSQYMLVNRALNGPVIGAILGAILVKRSLN